MQRGITAKWRPSLALVLACTLAVILCLPLAGILVIRELYEVIGYRESVGLVAIGVLVVAIYVGWVLWRILLRPISALVDAVDVMRAGKDTAPLPHYGTSEMRALGQAMLDMGAALEGRATVLRTYADHVTHELKSPLTVVGGAAELLEDPSLPAGERTKLITKISKAADRMTQLLDAQRALAHAQEPMPTGVCTLYDLDLPDGVNITSDAQIPLSKEVLQLVLGHLIGNAFRHGAQTVTLNGAPDMLVISDDGAGISDGNRARIFDPFFTTCRNEGGTGMGLPIVERMLAVQGARIILRDTPGAVFEISF